MRWIVQAQLLVLGGCLCLCCAQTDDTPWLAPPEADGPPPLVTSYDRELYQRIASAEQDRFRKRVQIPTDAFDDDVPDSSAMRPTGASARINPPTGARPSGKTAGNVGHDLALGIVFILAATLLVRRCLVPLAASIQAKHDLWALAPAAAAALGYKVRVEEEAFTEFLAAFRGEYPAGSIKPGMITGAKPIIPHNPVEDFFGRAPMLLRPMRGQIEAIGSESDSRRRQKLLAELSRQISTLKSQVGIPELQPVWQMTCSLEGLVKQLTTRASNVTPSTVRTVRVGLELLDELCLKRFDADLATSPPVRLLAVDDDRISRRALSRALTMALREPELAENGETALTLASRETYDVIFLDVQMPGMDGFELCAKIHATGCNSLTPVVFVTCQSDFDSRTRSTLCGGTDLVGKPFLTFEITLKALTLALHRRLQARDQIAAAAGNSTRSEQPQAPSPEKISLESGGAGVAMPPAKPSTPPPPHRRRRKRKSVRRQERLRSDRTVRTPSPEPAGHSPSTAQPLPANPLAIPGAEGPLAPTVSVEGDLADAFFNRVPAQIEAARNLIQAIEKTAEAEDRQEMLLDLYLRIHSLTLGAEEAELRPVLQIGTALEGLLNKLLEHPGHFTPSALQTVMAAMALTHEFCARKVKTDLLTHAPIRMLAVDDDPIARRVMGGALQMAFDKPDLAETGEEALALAAEHSYDVIFLDVLMPVMDGFTLCPKLHETRANTNAPVVFVTSCSTPESLDQARRCGGSDFITKPFQPTEIIVKALTYALRRRLQQLE